MDYQDLQRKLNNLGFAYAEISKKYGVKTIKPYAKLKPVTDKEFINKLEKALQIEKQIEKIKDKIFFGNILFLSIFVLLLTLYYLKNIINFLTYHKQTIIKLSIILIAIYNLYGIAALKIYKYLYYMDEFIIFFIIPSIILIGLLWLLPSKNQLSSV